MKVFVDSSAWIAYFNRNDKFNSEAIKFLNTKPSLVSSNIVLHETIAVLENRIDKKTAEIAACHILDSFLVEMIIISRSAEEQAFAKYKKGAKKVSFVDYTNFVLMKENGIEGIFAFDEDFKNMGLKILP